MTKERYEGYRAVLAAPVEEILEGLLTYPYVVEIDKEEDYMAVTILIDSAVFEEDIIASAEDLVAFYSIPMLGSYINVYRMLVGLDNVFSIFIEDSEMGIRLCVINYPVDAPRE